MKYHHWVVKLISGQMAEPIELSEPVSYQDLEAMADRFELFINHGVGYFCADIRED